MNWNTAIGRAALVGALFSSVACSSSDPETSSSDEGGGAGAGGQQGIRWVKGNMGVAQAPIVLSEHSGSFQGLTVSAGMHTRGADAGLDVDVPESDAGGMDDGGDGGAADGGPSDGGVDLTPNIDFSGMQGEPTFDSLWFGLPLVQGQAPSVGIVKPDGSVSVVPYFSEEELTTSCFQTVDREVNGVTVPVYAGLSVDLVTCMNRHFAVSNGSDKVWELFESGNKEVLASGLPSPSAVVCDPQGFLVVSTLPGFKKNLPNGRPVEPVKLFKVTLSGQVSELASLPVTDEYIRAQDIATCWQFPFTQLAKPNGLFVPVALDPNGHYLVGDVGARLTYDVSPDGQTVTQVGTMPIMTSSMIRAPNDVTYLLDTPLLGKKAGEPWQVLRGATLSGWDGSAWVRMTELGGYSDYIPQMSWGEKAVDCPSAFSDYDLCAQGWGVFMKIAPGVEPVLYMMDPVKGQLLAIPLSITSADAGAESGADASLDGSVDGSVEDSSTDVSPEASTTDATLDGDSEATVTDAGPQADVQGD